MNAAVFYGPNNIRLEQVRVENLPANNILLETLACSVCSYDVRTFRNGSFKVSPPVILGHEICAKTVNDIESEKISIKSGTRVSIYPVIPCLCCWYCHNKLYNLCSNLKEIGSTLNGGFASYISVPKMLLDIGGLVPVLDGVSDEEASLIEPLACCINGINQIKGSSFESAIILGDGPIGVMQSMLLKKYFPKTWVVVCGKVQHRLDSARKAGADMTYLINEETQKEENLERLKASGGEQHSPNLVFVSNNNPASLGMAAKLANKGGKIVIFSGIKRQDNTQGTKSLIDIDANFIHYSQVSIHGSFSSNPENLYEAMGLVQRKEIDLKALVTSTYPLVKINNALQTAESFKGLKSVITKF
ncbi:MAG TPA: alcohol dehydrogenase catalytic domain-containing protein [Candidatus Saccharimonadales bacterium]|nr:alcohol dehydrogenase catalytic domain-containing protein [Candidatus Saccharimonadales bacterium]